MKKSELKQIIKEEIKRILFEDNLDKEIKNPETGKMIKLSTALSYDKKHPAYKLAIKMTKKDNKLKKGDRVSYTKTKGAGVKIPFNGTIVSIDKDGKYVEVRNQIGDIDYIETKNLKGMK